MDETWREKIESWALFQLKQSGKLVSSLGCHEGPKALRRWWRPRTFAT